MHSKIRQCLHCFSTADDWIDQHWAREFDFVVVQPDFLQVWHAAERSSGSDFKWLLLRFNQTNASSPTRSSREISFNSQLWISKVSKVGKIFGRFLGKYSTLSLLKMTLVTSLLLLPARWFPTNWTISTLGSVIEALKAVHVYFPKYNGNLHSSFISLLVDQIKLTWLLSK